MKCQPVAYRGHHSYKDVESDALTQEAWIHVLEKHVGSLEGVLMLDVGCGLGGFALACSRVGARVIGVEPSHNIHVTKAGITNALGYSIPLVQADGCTLPFKSGSFDLVVSIGVLEHIGTPDDLVEEMARVVRPGGKMLLYFGPNKILRFAQSTSHRNICLTYWTPQDAEKAMRAHGILPSQRVWSDVIQYRFQNNHFKFGRPGLYSGLVKLIVRSSLNLRLGRPITLMCKALEHLSLPRNVGLIGSKR